jgi:hypothetical protein
MGYAPGGHGQRGTTMCAKWMLAVAILAGCMGMVGCSDSDGSDLSQAQSTSPNKVHRIATANLGCASLDTYNRAVKLFTDPASDQSKEEVQNLFDSGKCIELDPGTVVQVIDDEELKGRIKIRPEGESDAYWTMRVVVDP